MKLKIENRIDSELVNSAEEELYQILLQQRALYTQRLYGIQYINKMFKILRWAGFVLSVIGTVLCTILYSLKPGWSSHNIDGLIIVISFIAFSLFFYYMPFFEKRVKSYVQSIGRRSCKKFAARCVKKAKKLAPFNSVYEIKGDLITYYRTRKNTDDVWDLAWFRRLKGVAIYGNSATAIFKKWSSIHPNIILLHKDFTPFKEVLDTLNIEYKKRI